MAGRDGSAVGSVAADPVDPGPTEVSTRSPESHVPERGTVPTNGGRGAMEPGGRAVADALLPGRGFVAGARVQGLPLVERVLYATTRDPLEGDSSLECEAPPCVSVHVWGP